MGKHSVDIVLSAQDKYSAVFGKFENSLAGLARKAASIGGAYFGARSIFNFGADSVREFAEHETAFLKLAGGLAATGDKGGVMARQMRISADELERLSGIEDNVILRSMALGASLGKLSGDQLLKATQAAIGWATILDRDVNETMLMVVRAANGNITAFRKLGVAFDEGATAAENFNRVLAEGETGFALTQALADTTGRKIQDLSNAWKGLKQQAGETLAPPASFLMEQTEDLLHGLEVIAKLARGERLNEKGQWSGEANWADLAGKMAFMGKYAVDTDDATNSTKILNKETELFDKRIRELKENLDKVRFGEETAEYMKYSQMGISLDKITELDLIHEKVKKFTEDKKQTDAFNESLKNLDREISLFGKDSYEGKLFDLKSMGITGPELFYIEEKIQHLRQLERESEKNTPDWGRSGKVGARELNEYLRYPAGASLSDNYEAETAKNTRGLSQKIDGVTKEIRRLSEIILSKKVKLFTADLS